MNVIHTMKPPISQANKEKKLIIEHDLTPPPNVIVLAIATPIN
jgi:hypothetical protein